MVMKKNNFWASQLAILFVFAFILNTVILSKAQAVDCNNGWPACPRGQFFACPRGVPSGSRIREIYASCCTSLNRAGCKLTYGSDRTCNTSLGQCAAPTQRPGVRFRDAAAGTDADGASEVGRDDDNDGADDN